MDDSNGAATRSDGTIQVAIFQRTPGENFLLKYQPYTVMKEEFRPFAIEISNPTSTGLNIAQAEGYSNDQIIAAQNALMDLSTSNYSEYLKNFTNMNHGEAVEKMSEKLFGKASGMPTTDQKSDHHVTNDTTLRLNIASWSELSMYLGDKNAMIDVYAHFITPDNLTLEDVVTVPYT